MCLFADVSVGQSIDSLHRHSSSPEDESMSTEVNPDFSFNVPTRSMSVRLTLQLLC